MSRASPIGVALLGYGLAGQTFHAPLIAATPGLDLRVVVSSRPADVQADLPRVQVLADADQALARGDVDLVVIATPDALHAGQSIAALEAGKSVVVDKPFAPTLAEAERVATVARRSSGVFSVFQNRRWDGDFLTLRRLIAEGALGEIALFESRFDRFRPVATDRWKDRRDGGVWSDLGPHLVDQALQLFGSPRTVLADLARQRAGARGVDWFHVVLQYDRLRVVLQAGCLVADNSLRYAVHGDAGSFIKRGLDPQEAQSKSGLRPGEADWGRDPSPGELVRQGPDGPARQPVLSERGDYPRFYAEMRDAILTGSPPPVTLDQALTTMRVIDAGVRSAAEGRRVIL